MLILLTLFYGWSCDHVSGIDGKSRLALPLLSEAICLPLNPGECAFSSSNRLMARAVCSVGWASISTNVAAFRLRMFVYSLSMFLHLPPCQSMAMVYW